MFNLTYNKKEAARHVAHAYNSSILESWMEQAVLCEFEVSLTFIAKDHPRIHSETLSKNRRKR